MFNLVLPSIFLVSLFLNIFHATLDSEVILDFFHNDFFHQLFSESVNC